MNLTFRCLCCAVTILAALSFGGAAHAGTHVFDTPSDDQWQYPFNFPPTGEDQARFLFASEQPSSFDFRDSTIILRWQTDAVIEPGNAHAAYDIEAASVTVWCIGDGTPAAFNLGTTIDNIPQRIELFGVGFGPTYTDASWTENSPVQANGGGPPTVRDPWPQDLVSAANVSDVTPSVTPWAVGIPQAGSTTLSIYTVTFELDTNNPIIRDYIRDGLSTGHLNAMLASTIYAPGQAPASHELPRVILKEGVATYPGSHAPRLEVKLGPGSARPASDVAFDTPAGDRWHYPFNATPGDRASGPLFVVSDATDLVSFNYRDGLDIISWNTESLVPKGLSLYDYQVESCTVTVWNIADASWDLTGTNSFGIPHRIELFGVGFDSVATAETWTESTAYVGAGPSTPGTARDPFPIHYRTGGHAEDATTPVDITWALGEPVGYTPGAMTNAFPIVFAPDVTSTTTQLYLRESLAAGVVHWMVAATFETSQQAAPGPVPNLIFKEGVSTFGGNPALLEMTVSFPGTSSVKHWRLMSR